MTIVTVNGLIFNSLEFLIRNCIFQNVNFSGIYCTLNITKHVLEETSKINKTITDTRNHRAFNLERVTYKPGGKMK